MESRLGFLDADRTNVSWIHSPARASGDSGERSPGLAERIVLTRRVLRAGFTIQERTDAASQSISSRTLADLYRPIRVILLGSSSQLRDPLVLERELTRIQPGWSGSFRKPTVKPSLV